jgi:hypothetical protein
MLAATLADLSVVRSGLNMVKLFSFLINLPKWSLKPKLLVIPYIVPNKRTVSTFGGASIVGENLVDQLEDERAVRV